MSKQLGSRLHRDEKIAYLDQLANLNPKARKDAERLNAEKPEMSMPRFKTAVAAIQRRPPILTAEAAAKRGKDFADLRTRLAEPPAQRRQDVHELEQGAGPVENELKRTTGLGWDPHYYHLGLAEKREGK